MSIDSLILSRRTIRQFKPRPIAEKLLRRIVNAARLAPSGSNLQPLEFVVVNRKNIAAKVFPCLKWAGYVAPEGNPKPGNEPVAYVIVLVNTGVRKKGYEHDAGAAVENMILLAWEHKVGSCWIGSVERERVQEILGIPASYKIDSVLALGYPAEQPVVEEMKDSVKYWKDKAGRLHVPKRKLEDIIHINRF